jgi:hypothetical protein
MTNTIAPFGFKPVRRFDGAAWTGNFTQCKMQNNAGALNRGDGVVQLADGTVAVAAAGVGHPFRGIFIGCHYLLAALGYPIWTNYWPGSGAVGLVDAFIVDDPNLVFEVQASAGPITMADIGMNADVVVAASTTGFSKWSLGVPAATVTFPFKIMGPSNNGVNIGDGYDVTVANNLVEVMPNEWFLTKGLGF